MTLYVEENASGRIYFDSYVGVSDRAYDVIENVRSKALEIEIGFRATKWLDAENGSLLPGAKFLDSEDREPLVLPDHVIEEMEHQAREREARLETITKIMELRGEPMKYQWLLR